jgi:hypothetical protein
LVAPLAQSGPIASLCRARNRRRDAGVSRSDFSKTEQIMSSIPSDAMPKASAAPEEAGDSRVKRAAQAAGSAAKKAGGAAAKGAGAAGKAAGKAATSVAGAARRNPKKAIAAGVAVAAGVAAAAVLASRRKKPASGGSAGKAAPKKK